MVNANNITCLIKFLEEYSQCLTVPYDSEYRRSFSEKYNNNFNSCVQELNQWRCPAMINLCNPQKIADQNKIYQFIATCSAFQNVAGHAQQQQQLGNECQTFTILIRKVLRSHMFRNAKTCLPAEPTKQSGVAVVVVVYQENQILEHICQLMMRFMNYIIRVCPELLGTTLISSVSKQCIYLLFFVCYRIMLKYWCDYYDTNLALFMHDLKQLFSRDVHVAAFMNQLERDYLACIDWNLLYDSANITRKIVKNRHKKPKKETIHVGRKKEKLF